MRESPVRKQDDVGEVQAAGPYSFSVRQCDLVLSPPNPVRLLGSQSARLFYFISRLVQAEIVPFPVLKTRWGTCTQVMHKGS
ncbi:unnamed protein product [Pleuronectes platessa]|uniref:Uncharacterized protein n=1 Tax=Pleuronectes platessa TaxID=8262 RepID=A0A9N7UVX3_PLEPL|nr:unnamed protein product [Pleuronectes platessa]